MITSCRTTTRSSSSPPCMEDNPKVISSDLRTKKHSLPVTYDHPVIHSVCRRGATGCECPRCSFRAAAEIAYANKRTVMHPKILYTPQYSMAECHQSGLHCVLSGFIYFLFSVRRSFPFKCSIFKIYAHAKALWTDSAPIPVPTLVYQEAEHCVSTY